MYIQQNENGIKTIKSIFRDCGAVNEEIPTDVQEVFFRNKYILFQALYDLSRDFIVNVMEEACNLAKLRGDNGIKLEDLQYSAGI